MEKYWPVAIIVTDNGPDSLFTTDAALTIEKAESQFDVWEKGYGFKTAARWIERDDGQTMETIRKKVDMAFVKELWDLFGKVPINPDTERIESWWGSPLWNNSFRPGTHREEIWNWFEETFDISVTKDLMRGISLEQETEKALTKKVLGN